jgi:glycosyltransferase involved in cell wall biosynthesis
MTLNQLKICLVAGTLGQGGAERQLYYIIKALLSKGTEIHLIILTRNEYWEQPIIDLGIKIYYAGDDSSRINRVIEIVKLVKLIKPSLIQSIHFYTNIYVTIASTILKIPGIGSIRSNVYFEFKSSGKFFGHLSFRLPKYLIVNSKAAILNSAKLGRVKNIYYLPNVVDTERFSPRGDNDNLNDQIIITVGRFDTNKNLDQFLWIMKELKIKFQNIKGYVIGDGKQKSNLLELAEKYQLQNGTVTFTGNVNNVEYFYRKSTIFVMTSSFEGTPNVILEAMSTGLPVVSTAVGSLCDIINTGENGFIVEIGDKEKILSYCTLLLKDRHLSGLMGSKARTSIIQNFSPETLPAYLSSIYAKILS